MPEDPWSADRPWIRRAMDSKSYPRASDSYNQDGHFIPGVKSDESVRTESSNVAGREILYPTIRLVDGVLRRYSQKDALKIARKNGDFIEFDSPDAATAFSKALSDKLGGGRKGLMGALGKGAQAVFSADR